MNGPPMNGGPSNGPPDHQAFLNQLDGQLDSFRRSDIQRDALVQEIVHKYVELQQQLHNKSEDYENELASRRMWQAEARNYQQALNAANTHMDNNPFVLVLIDGDGAIFHDYLYKCGSDGGADAAQHLYTAVKNHVAECYPDRNTTSWEIMVQIFYNMEGLSHKLKSVGVLKNPNEMAAFARAFSLNKALFSFIDVGSGKERADHKVRETLRLFLPNMQCKHVIFGGCHDNGYLPALDPYKRDQSMGPRITLLETLPIQPGFTQLGFKVVQFPSVFRSDPLPEKALVMMPPSVQNIGITQTTPILPSRSNSAVAGATSPSPSLSQVAPANIPKSSSPQLSTEHSSANASWATVGKNAPKNINISTKKAPARKSIILNAYEERLDPDLPRPDTAAVSRLFERVRVKKVCNQYHLNGKCEVGGYCDYDHGERLSPGEQLALKHRARTRYCPDGGYCRDFDCTNGHVCPYGKNCRNDKCWFEATHGIDNEAAVRLYENGDKDWLKKF